MNSSYRLLRRVVTFWIHRFFRNIQIHGASNVPEGAVIFAVNHPNNLIDSLLVGFAIERKIHFLATARLFRNKFLARLLRSLGVIPVYRKQDAATPQEKNVATFQACTEILKERGAIAIYPEGRTHAEPRLQKIKTGAARIALETEQEFHPGVKIVPVGLNFSVRKSFREDVIINIGNPIPIDSYLESYGQNPTATVEKLTSDLQHSIEQEILHVPAPELDLLVKEIQEIYKAELIQDLMEEGGLRPDEFDEFRLSKKLIEGIEYFSRVKPELVLKIEAEVNSYMNRLRKVHLDDRLLKKITKDSASYRAFLVRIALLIAGFIPAGWGMINHFLPYQITRWLSRKMSKTETDYATVRILSGILLYTLFYAAQIYFVLSRFGWWAAAVYGFTLPVFGAFAYYYYEKLKLFEEDIRLFWVLITRRKLIQQLQTRRARLIAQMDRAKEEYLDANLQT